MRGCPRCKKHENVTKEQKWRRNSLWFWNEVYVESIISNPNISKYKFWHHHRELLQLFATWFPFNGATKKEKSTHVYQWIENNEHHVSALLQLMAHVGYVQCGNVEVFSRKRIPFHILWSESSVFSRTISISQKWYRYWYCDPQLQICTSYDIA